MHQTCSLLQRSQVSLFRSQRLPRQVPKEKINRKTRKLHGSTIRELNDSCSQTEIRKVDQATQTDDVLYTLNSPPQFKSTPLAELCHAVFSDHTYASSFSFTEKISKEHDAAVPLTPKQKLDFSEVHHKEESDSEDEYLLEMPECDESDSSDSDSYICEDVGDSDGSYEENNIETKSEFCDDDQGDSKLSNWLEDSCGDLREERKF